MNEIEVKVREWGRKNWYMTWQDPVTGLWKGQSTGTDNYEKAIVVASQKQIELNEGQQRADGKATWKEFATAYEEEHLASLAKNTKIRATGVLDNFRREVNPKNLRIVNTQVLREYLSGLRSKGLSEETVKLHRRTLRAALQWGVDAGYLAAVPQFPKAVKTRKGERKAKGRPLTDKEFVALLRATRAIVGRPAAKSWRRLLRGLWLSGLRIEESLAIGWTPDHELWIETEMGELPLLGIKATGEKGGKNRLLPLTPDFGAWILRTPQKARIGKVFSVTKMGSREPPTRNHASKIIAAIGEKAGVKVLETGKFASAHDLRRSFGLRWALRKISVFELQQLMRHSDIKTTEQYYVSIDAQAFAKRLWDASDGHNTFHNTKAKDGKVEPPQDDGNTGNKG